jgi:peptidyl-prolyl cis-trans isomerase C
VNKGLASLSLVVVVAVLTAPSGSSLAGMDAAEKARRVAIVAKVGDRTVTAGELEDRLAGVPRFQLQTFGESPDAIRMKFLQDVIVPEVLFARAAEEKSALDDVALEHARLRAMSNATQRATRDAIGRAADIPMDEVRAYYTQHVDHYDTPERVSVWRILCRSREEAASVLESAKKDTTPTGFMQLARDHSLDKATSMRGGNLGFLGPDGTSNEAGLKADPALVKAAASVKDGELVPAPVPEGGYFSVVWRRGTVGAMKRSIDDVKEQIRDTLFKQKLEDAQNKLLEDLRARELGDYNPDLVNAIDLTSGEGVVSRRRPGQVPPIGQIQTARPPTPAPSK